MVAQGATAIDKIESKYHSLAPMMDERMRRCWAATEAQAYGWGGVRAVSCATGQLECLRYSITTALAQP